MCIVANIWLSSMMVLQVTSYIVIPLQTIPLLLLLLLLLLLALLLLLTSETLSNRRLSLRPGGVAPSLVVTTTRHVTGRLCQVRALPGDPLQRGGPTQTQAAVGLVRVHPNINLTYTPPTYEQGGVRAENWSFGFFVCKNLRFFVLKFITYFILFNLLIVIISSYYNL